MITGERAESEEGPMFKRGVTSEKELRDLMGTPSERAIKKESAVIDEPSREFIAHSPFLLLATSDTNGRCDVSPKGDAPGFVRVLDERHLVIPDRPGNKRLDGLRNLLANPHVGMIFLIPGREETLRVNGRATIVRDEDVLESLAARGQQPPVAVSVTFTDLVLVDERGSLTIAKCASTPPDPSVGLMDGLSLLATELGIDLHGLLAETESIVHGTTVATNALLERKGAKVGLLTTEGHRDVIEMREGLKDDRYNLRMPPPVPLVPRVRRLGVRERMRFDGAVATPLSPRSLAAGIATLAKAKVEAVAVCYLHSYRNPRHEKLTGRAVARRLPGAYVSLSCEVLPQIKEYERVWTTVVNAYVGPALARYLKNLAARLESHGYRGDVLIIQSHGGVAPVRESTLLAAGAVLSGPAGGVA